MRRKSRIDDEMEDEDDDLDEDELEEEQEDERDGLRLEDPSDSPRLTALCPSCGLGEGRRAKSRSTGRRAYRCEECGFLWGDADY